MGSLRLQTTWLTLAVPFVLSGCGALLGIDFDRVQVAGEAAEAGLADGASAVAEDGAPGAGDGGGAVPSCCDGAVAADGAPIGSDGSVQSGPRVVLFGGRDETTTFGDTWEWNGTSWTGRTALSKAPPARKGHAMATLGKTVVLFGGLDKNKNPLGDTWTYDGAEWIVHGGVAPSARYSHVMAEANGKVVLFGGVADGSSSRETWEWDGASWSKKNVTDYPSARNSAAMASFGGRAILVGGATAIDLTGALNDVWAWDGASWTELPKGPAVSTNAGMAAVGTHLFHFGGADLIAETWAWDGIAWQKVASEGPLAHYSFSMTPLANKIVLFGGTYGAPSNKTYVFEGTSWNEVQVIGPASRQNHAAALLVP